MTVDEERKIGLTNFNAIKHVGRVIESDHNVETLEVNLQFSNVQSERMEIFQFKNRDSQIEFKKLTTNTTDFSSCFKNDLSFEDQSIKWRNVLEDYFFKAFKKVRVTNNHKVKKTEISVLLDKRKKIKNKTDMDEKDEEDSEN